MKLGDEFSFDFVPQLFVAALIVVLMVMFARAELYLECGLPSPGRAYVALKDGSDYVPNNYLSLKLSKEGFISATL